MQQESFTSKTYSGMLRIIHWLIAFLVFVTWPLGLMIQFAKDSVKLDFYVLHESLGFLVFCFMLVRVGLRLTTSQRPSAEGKSVDIIAARLVHILLYCLLILMPLSGFLATNAHGFPLSWFGLFFIPSPLGKSPDIAWTLSAIHEWSAWILLTFIALHVAAALFHHVIRKDQTLYRIL